MRRQPTRQTTPKTPRQRIQKHRWAHPSSAWTSPCLCRIGRLPRWSNLLRTLYSKQYLLNRMLQGETLYIEEPFVTALTDSPPRV